MGDKCGRGRPGTGVGSKRLHIAVGAQYENGIRDRHMRGTGVGGNRRRDSQDLWGLSNAIHQVQEGAAVNGVVVDHDDGVVERRNPFRSNETINLYRLIVRKPQRIECFDVLQRRVIGVVRRQSAA